MCAFAALPGPSRRQPGRRVVRLLTRFGVFPSPRAPGVPEVTLKEVGADGPRVLSPAVAKTGRSSHPLLGTVGCHASWGHKPYSPVPGG